jgi:hypothetical protein
MRDVKNAIEDGILTELRFLAITMIRISADYTVRALQSYYCRFQLYPQKLLPLPDQTGPEFVCFLTVQRELLPVPFLLCFRIEPGGNIF